MRRLSIDVAGNDVRLNFVALHVRTRRGMGYWIQHPEQFAGLVAVAELREGDDCPHGSMRVLSAVFADARHVSSNVARIMRWVVKRRREEPDQALGAAYQLFVHGGHGASGTAGVGCATHDSPGLRDGINATFGIFGGAERSTVVEVGAAIPFAVPPCVLKRRLERAHVETPALPTFILAAHIRNLCKFPENRVKEPAKPNAFSLAMLADAIHTVVPIARPHQWQAMAANGETAVQCSRAMFEERAASL